jgi:hypothetical protein
VEAERIPALCAILQGASRSDWADLYTCHYFLRLQCFSPAAPLSPTLSRQSHSTDTRPKATHALSVLPERRSISSGIIRCRGAAGNFKMHGNPLNQSGLSRRAQAETGGHDPVDLMSPAQGVDVHEQRIGGTTGYGIESYADDSRGVLNRHPSTDPNILLFDPAIFSTQQYPPHTHAQDERVDGFVHNADYPHTTHQGPLAASQSYHGAFKRPTSQYTVTASCPKTIRDLWPA